MSLHSLIVSSQNPTHHSRILLLWFSPNSHREDNYVILTSACLKARGFNKVTVLLCHQDIFTSQSDKSYVLFCAIQFSTFIFLVWKFNVQQRVKNTYYNSFNSQLPHYTHDLQKKKKDGKKAGACEEFSCNREQFVHLQRVDYSCESLTGQ